MKHFAYSILGCLLLSLNAAFAQKTWSFDGHDPLLSSDGKSLLNLYTIKEIPEFVAGVEGKALRTDGYSTWMETTAEGEVSSFVRMVCFGILSDGYCCLYGNQRHGRNICSGMCRPLW